VTKVVIKLDRGHHIEAFLYDRELPKYKLHLGYIVNFQVKFSITSDSYIVTKIGSLKGKNYTLRLVA